MGDSLTNLCSGEAIVDEFILFDSFDFSGEYLADDGCIALFTICALGDSLEALGDSLTFTGVVLNDSLIFTGEALGDYYDFLNES